MHFLYRHEMQDITPQLKRILMSHITGLSTARLLAEPNLQLTEEQRVWMEEAICRLENNEPLQHVLGYGEFYGRKFKCDSRALVPRPETEELVDWIINDWATINSRQLPINVIDIGTGTGCIALSLAKELEGAKITAVDISTAALSLARENAEILEAKDVRFIECDILRDCNVIEEDYDVIVSDPPYVRECEKKEMEANVLDYDPHTALFVSDEDPLVFYRAIAEFALTHLTPNGALYFEINQYLGRETCDLLVAMGYKNVELRDDINGNARMVRATL